VSTDHAARFTPSATEPSWLWALRSSAMESFAASGFPTPALEDWKHARLKPLVGADWSAAPQALAAPTDLDERLTTLPACRLVLVDGVLDQARSSMDALPAGVTLLSARAAVLSHPELVQRALARSADHTSRAFVALNLAFWTDGLLLHVARGVAVEQPIALVVASSRPGTTAVRNLILVDDNASVAVVEHYTSLTADARVNAVTEAQTAAGARLDHVVLQDHHASTLHVATLDLAQHRDSIVNSYVFSLGGAVARTEIRSRLQAPGATCQLRGLAVGNAKQHHDLLTFVDHAVTNGTSNQAFKSILGDRSTGVFNGMVLVRAGADGTNAQQSNHNLLLSDLADAHARPQLEIHTDDVKCSHGATVGALDAEALFFLRSRGIPEPHAKAILTRAFADTVVEGLPEALRAPVERALEGALR